MSFGLTYFSPTIVHQLLCCRKSNRNRKGTTKLQSGVCGMDEIEICNCKRSHAHEAAAARA